MISKDINTPEMFNWKIALALIIAWILVYMCMIKGIASSGKVRLITKSENHRLHVNFRSSSSPGCVCDRYVSVHRLNHLLLPGRHLAGHVGRSAAPLHAEGATLQLTFFLSGY